MNRPQKLIKLKACSIIFTEDVFKDDVFMSFERMTSKYELPKRNLWKMPIHISAIQEVLQSNPMAMAM